MRALLLAVVAIAPVVCQSVVGTGHAAAEVKVTAGTIVDARPVGTDWIVNVQGTGAATFGCYLIGAAPTSLDLSIIGSPCNQLVASPEIVLASATGAGTLEPWLVTIPNNTALFGFALYVQGVTEGAPQPPYSAFAGLPLTLALSSSLVATVGP